MKKRTTVLLTLLTLALAPAAWAQKGQPPTSAGVESLVPIRHDVSPPLNEMRIEIPAPKGNREVPNRLPFIPPQQGDDAGGPDPLRQSEVGRGPTPAPLLSFDGTSDADNGMVAGGRIVPPDTEGDVGLRNYVQSNNLVFEVFNKTTGASVFGPVPNNTIWAGFGGICQTTNSGDPIVLFDDVARRWIFTQFAIGANGVECIAVSTTSNPLGPYNRYAYNITIGGLNDYPKLGVWPDGLYMSVNEFAPGFIGAAAVAFDKAAMYAGAAAPVGIKFTLPFTGIPPIFFSLQPTHLEGRRQPPVGDPNIFWMAFDDQVWGTGGGPDGYQHWAFSPNFVTPALSTFTYLGLIPTAGFDAAFCGFSRNCIEQPAPGTVASGNGLDVLGQFTMFRAAGRTFKNHEAVVLTHSVDVTGADDAGNRWTEFRGSGTTWTIFQTGTYAPADGNSRWMGSIAQDTAGNTALGYSISGTGQYPGVRYTTRMAADPLGTMPGGEAICHDGSGSQINSFNRWGDYSTMSVDPIDQCTFWYTNEYYPNDSAFNFQTRICSFRFPRCGCHGGFTKGGWNLPGGGLTGYQGGYLYDPSGAILWKMVNTLISTSPTGGIITGTVYDGIAPDPDFTVTGTYTITNLGPPVSGTWQLQMFDAFGNLVGKAGGKFSDKPSTTSIGGYKGKWKLCNEL